MLLVISGKAAKIVHPRKRALYDPTTAGRDEIRAHAIFSGEIFTASRKIEVSRKVVGTRSGVSRDHPPPMAEVKMVAQGSLAVTLGYHLGLGHSRG